MSGQVHKKQACYQYFFGTTAWISYLYELKRYYPRYSQHHINATPIKFLSYHALEKAAVYSSSHHLDNCPYIRCGQIWDAENTA